MLGIWLIGWLICRQSKYSVHGDSFIAHCWCIYISIYVYAFLKTLVVFIHVTNNFHLYSYSDNKTNQDHRDELNCSIDNDDGL